ncbi:hypothetical protein QNH47_06290 [Virgibacillus halodenitrificans]|uniref:hypothetical protein n=1 Tax=Virgibacillus halodenitrificans TaxID=1482 RepID=UPI0024BF319F|nr:hypothetical protein [Virgibacillus halodenitrificans]WHX27461.1 hypothetical protein QNH47_06290 [Virgibacillus halodenitrificans]
MDVKSIRDERYYKELGYSNFDDYCKDAWGVDKGFINERIKIADTFGSEKAVAVATSLGHKKSLLLSRMTEDQRTQALEQGVPTDKGVKAYEDATRREIIEWRKKAERAEEARERAERERAIPG